MPNLHKKIIIGLGNMGQQFENSPHNLGFMFVDQLIKQHLDHQSINFTYQSAFLLPALQSITSKPNTQMNLSGFVLREIYNKFYKKIHPNDFIRLVIVVHDDADLPMFHVKIKDGLVHTGSGGHNGIRHMVQISREIGCDEAHATGFFRIRLGCRPERDCHLKDYVCKKMHHDSVIEWMNVIRNLLEI